MRPGRVSVAARGRNRRRWTARWRPVRARAAAAALGALLLVAAAALGGWRLLATADLLRIREVRFAGLQRAGAAELAALATVKPGDHLLAADLEALERAVARHPWVRSAEARRRLPPAVEVRVEERAPRALVDLGGLYLVDREAQVFGAAPGDGLTCRWHRLHARRLPAAPRTSSRSWPGRCPAEGCPARASRPSARFRVHVDPDEGVTLYVGEEATQVRLGVGDLPQKLERLHRVLGRLRADGRRAEVLHLDNRSRPSWVTVRLASAAGRAKGQPDEAAPERVGGMGGRGFIATPHVDGKGPRGPR
jgi:cell division protein FtsQ